MRKTILALGAIGLLLVATGISANAQQADDSRFHGRGDRGELVNVLPPSNRACAKQRAEAQMRPRTLVLRFFPQVTVLGTRITMAEP